MPLVAELRPKATRNLHGEATWGSPIYPHCHVQLTGRQVYTGNDVVRTEEGIVYLDGSYPVDTTWTMLIPQVGAVNRRVTIISVDQNTDEDGWHHTAVHYGAL